MTISDVLIWTLATLKREVVSVLSDLGAYDL